MTLTQLKYLIAVSKYQNFSKAADSCNVSQPSLSTQIQNLESELGTLLFDRSKSPIIATELGEKIIKQAKKTLNEIDTIKDLVQMDSAEISGKLNIGIIPSLAPYIIPLFLRKTLEKYPKLRLIFYEATRSELFEKLTKEELDLVIAPSPSFKHGFNEKTIFYEPFVAYVSENHRLFKKNKIAIDELDIDDILLLNHDHCMRQHTDNLISDLVHSVEKQENQLLFESGNLETLKSLVESDYSMTLLPYLAIHKRTDKKTMMHVREFSLPEPKRELSIFYIRSFQKLTLINAVYDEIRNAVPPKLLKKENCVITCLEELRISLC